jgi:preprotein translocase subunit SecA
LLQLKERCSPTPETDTIARTSYPRFFRRYLHLSGMSGTLRESATELRRVYGLVSVPVPLRRPALRRDLGIRIFTSPATRWAAVTDRVRQMQAAGRPVLIGTDSIEASEALAACLRDAGLACQVLHARQDADEAAVIARAGERGQVTVATRMAGRGTDIRLAPGIADLGGLHVINCQRNASRRLDRQLAGRGARQGDPGSAELCHVCDPVRGSLAALRTNLMGSLGNSSPTAQWRGPGWWLQLLARGPLWMESARQRRLRAQLLRADREWADKLNFTDSGG